MIVSVTNDLSITLLLWLIISGGLKWYKICESFYGYSNKTFVYITNFNASLLY